MKKKKKTHNESILQLFLVYAFIVFGSCKNSLDIIFACKPFLLSLSSLSFLMLPLCLQRESLLLQIEMLKREIAASLHDRDKAIKECNDLRERFGAKEDTNKEWEGSYKDHDNYKQERLLFTLYNACQM